MTHLHCGWTAQAAPATAVVRPEDRALLLLTAAQEEGAALYLLLDTASDESVMEHLAAASEPFAVLGPGKKNPELVPCSPVLVHCDEGTTLVDWFAREAWGGNHGVALTSPCELEQLAEHLDALLTVNLEGRGRLFFRLYDPRILRTYLPTCTEAEVAHFFGPVKRFLVEPPGGTTILDFHRNHPASGHAGPGPSPIGEDGCLIIRLPQLEALQEAAAQTFCERLQAHLREHFPERCDELEGSSLADLVEESLGRAPLYGFESEQDICNFAALLLTLGNDFDSNPSIPWAGSILNDRSIHDPGARLKALYREADRQLAAVAEGGRKG